MMKNPELARQMRALRTVNHYTQQQIADILNIDRTTYTSYEISKNTPDVMLLDAFAKIFSVDIDFILHIDTQNIDTLCDEVEAYEANNAYRGIPHFKRKGQTQGAQNHRVLQFLQKRAISGRINKTVGKAQAPGRFFMPCATVDTAERKRYNSLYCP